MTNGYGYDPHGQQPPVLGYDAYGRPVYQQPPQQQDPGAQPYDPYDPYATSTGRQQPVPDPYADPAYGEQTYGGSPYPDGRHAQGTYPGQPYAEQPYAADAYAGQPYAAPGPAEQTGRIPQQGQGYDPYGTAVDTGGRVPPQAPPDQRRAAQGGEYHTEQFAFVEEPTDDSEDVIDWLKFTESRTERREEAKRRGRNRKRALVVLVVLAMVGGLGYLWQAGKLPGIGGGPGATTPAAGQQRDVLLVHLRSTESDASSTALLVDNATTEQATTLLLPNSLAVSTADGDTTTLGKSVEAEGATPTRDALDRLFGAQIKGTWRLDTPYLEILADSVGGVTVDTDATVPGKKKDDGPLVEKGKDKTLDGQAAVAYATHRGDGETKAAQLKRFGRVMEATLMKISSDKAGATNTVKSLGQILDPSLSQESLGATLAQLSDRVKSGAYKTSVLPVADDGTLSRQTSDGLVKKVLGGTVQNSDPDAAPRVSVRNASGDEGADDAARVALVNGGYTVVGTGTGDSARTASQVIYAHRDQKAKAQEVAKTLGLPGGAVEKGDGAGNADVTVVLGKDYEG